MIRLVISNQTFGLVPQPFQRVEHRLQVRQRDFGVEIFGEGLQVDVGGVDVLVNVEEGLARDVAVGHHHGVQAVLRAPLWRCR